MKYSLLRFDKLERGQYPSLREMKKMKNDYNFDFLKYDDSIINPEFYGYQTIEWAELQFHIEGTKI